MPGDEEQRSDEAAPAGTVALYDARASLKPLSKGMAVAWCVASGVCAGISPLIAPLFVGFAYALVAGCGGMRERLLAAACLIVPAVICVAVLGFTSFEDALFACIVGITAAQLFLAGKLTPGIACISVVILSALLLAVSEAIVRLAGTTLATQFALVIDVYLDALEASSIEMQAAVAQMRTIVNAIWPTAFVIIAFMGFALATFGARIGAARQLVDLSSFEPFDRFDLPLWMVGCLIGAIAILSLSRAIPSQADLLAMVGGTMLCSLRLAFATQGYAVLAWLKHTRGWYGLLGVIITVIAVFLEFNMFVLTIVGVLDVWMNIRHLDRGVRVTIQDPADRS